MPKDDTWQDGNTLDTMGEMDSTGSCDSVVSFNSCFSDDSLEFLSAEEKACLTFLEETIQSLDTEDDSGLSNDEPDQIPARGNVATKAARLSASIVFNKPPDTPKRHFESPMSSGSPGKKDILNYMVPTPFILANRPASRIKNLSHAESQEGPQAPSEVNVVVIPPPHKTKSKNDTDEENLNKVSNASRRGPLSYEGLVQLRKTASMRKPEEQQQVSANKVNPVTQSLHPKSKEHKSSKSFPPPVAPKPRIKAPMNPEGPPNSQNARALTVDDLMNPEKVRLEALCKLGLLKVESNARQLETKGPNVISQQPLPPRVAPKPKKPLHQRSASDIPDPPCPQHNNMTSAGKLATLERANRGPSGSDTTELNTEQVSSSRSKSQHVQGFSVPVHSIGKDRREALRKLGLLKN
ncbi:hypothetical protein IRJ41_012997 [Triplophysa rosa]|uniref:Specifically androgen-regulated gene protein n=1 Tax=Triplophysa rosa TaxID=992332 RepID=A0A9W7WDR0_TRIRA|nr:hypothetical protein IRJ41_012997 [Triplophysa rosa]